MVGQRIGKATTAMVLALAACDAPTPAPNGVASVVPPVATSSTPSAVHDASAVTESAAVDAVAPSPSPSPSASVALPAVRVANIGMHIGGGPNDDVTKAPIAKSVAPHFDELRACFALLEKPMQVELGVDLLIEPAGGKAKVTNPRSTAPGTQLRDCGVKVFESIDFLPPKTGKTMVSYSVQFSPQK